MIYLFFCVIKKLIAIDFTKRNSHKVPNNVSKSRKQYESIWFWSNFLFNIYRITMLEIIESFQSRIFKSDLIEWIRCFFSLFNLIFFRFSLRNDLILYYDFGSKSALGEFIQHIQLESQIMLCFRNWYTSNIDQWATIYRTIVRIHVSHETKK